MSTTPKELREKRAGVWNDMKALLDETESAGMSAEDSEKYTKLEAEYDRLSNDIGARDRAAEYEARMNDSQPTPKGLQTPAPVQQYNDESRTYQKAFRKYLVGGMDSLNTDERAQLSKAYTEARALGVGTGSGGGYTVPEGFRNQVIEKQLAYANIRNWVEVISTPTGNTILWTTNDSTTQLGAIVAENVATTELDVAFGTAQLGAFMYSSKIVRASLQFLQDTGIENAEGWLADKLAERIARIQNRHFTIGVGTTEPQGIVPTATVGVTAASTTAVTGDELIDLAYSVDPAYRANGRYMVRDATVGALRKLKATTGEYLWQPSLTAGAPDAFAGFGVIVNPDMPAPAADAKTVLFGDFRSAYVVRDVSDFQLMRLTERYAEYFQVGFLGFQRSDGVIQNLAAYRALAQAAS